MKVSIGADIPNLGFAANLDEIVDACGARQAINVYRRTAAGRDVDGASLPRPKLGGQPLNHTGAFLRSIGMRRSRRWSKPGAPVTVVLAGGNRPDGEHRRALAHHRNAGLKAARMLGALFTSLGPNAGSLARTKRGKVKLEKLTHRFRAANTNASLAAILSRPPRDVRGRHGNRGIYRVMSVSEGERTELVETARRTMRVELLELGRRLLTGERS